MLKLMIVDDEFFVRRGIVDSIDWNAYDIMVCGEAADGVEALSSISELQPDIILTDIKMGKMDGLEFIFESQKILPRAKFIILSGHDDFEYARRAISLGVSEYLLKPIGAEELIASVTKLKESIQNEKTVQDARKSSLQDNLMFSWNIPQAPLPLETSWFQVFMLSVDNAKELSVHTISLPTNANISNITILVQDYFTLSNINHIVKRVYDNVYVIVLNYAQPQSDFSSVTECLREYMLKECGAQITLGIGRQYQGYYKINDSYNEAFSALGYKYAFPISSDIKFELVPAYFVYPYMHNANLKRFKKDIQNFIKAFETDSASYDKLEEQLFLKIGQQEISLKDVKTLCLKLCILGLNTLDNKAYQTAERRRISLLMNLEQLTALIEIRQRMHQIFSIVQEVSQTTLYGNYQNIVDIVIHYVHSHYSENVSLYLLAQIVHVTPNYLSRIFKETVGENFKEWLTRYRIERSKDLLVDSSLKMYEIAALSGFSDYKHFSSIFKKQTGCSAKEYRISVLKIRP